MLFGSLGVLLTSVEAARLISHNSAELVKSIWWIFLGIGLVLVLFKSYPRTRISSRLQGRDIQITIAVTDIFKELGDIIVASNSTFDTDIQGGIISAKSIQGQFTQKFLPSVSELDKLLDRELEKADYEEVANRKGKTKKYDIGTVCRIDTSGPTGYFVAICHMNEYGNAEGKFQFLQDSLPRIWEFIAKKGRKENIRIPILGSGFSRVSEKRETIIMEIVKSFIASCSESSFCEDLVICVHPNDYGTNKVDLGMLEDFLEYQCRFTDLSGRAQTGIGTPL